MLTALLKLAGLAFLTVVLAAAAVLSRHGFADARQISRLQADKDVLQQVVARLSAERRVADVLVTNQATVGGVLRTDLLFVEYDKAGEELPPKRFTVEGEVVHVGALVIKFDRSYVKEGDELRGRSIALFTRLYGDHQPPADAFPIDSPGEVPAAYRGADPVVTAFERELWANFWKLADDPDYAASQGVRVANAQSVWGMFKPGRLYTLTLEADGGLSLQAQKLKGIYQEALSKYGG